MTIDPEMARPAPAPPRTKFFRRRQEFAPLTADEALRQGAISALAFQLLGGRDPALNFLNTENSRLGGRPLDLAMSSADSYSDVEREIRACARRRSGGCVADPGSRRE